MRTSSTLIASAVAAVAVAGSSSAAITAVDPFTTVQVGGPGSIAGPGADPDADPAFPPVGGLFNSRSLVSGVSILAGTTKLQFDSTYAGGFNEWYNAGSSSSGVDLTAGHPDGFQITFNFDLSGSGSYEGGATTRITLELLTIGTPASLIQEFFVGGAGTATLTVLASQYGSAAPVFSNITTMYIYADAGTTGWISDFNIAAAPAPGAIALLGAAGMIGMRRRKA